ncbi:Transcriptional enhancer factor TEF-1, partial [Fragariocoptes setiger]
MFYENQGSPEDAHGDNVWSAEIEQAFQEACIMYPTCGRRKIIVQDQGEGSHKMFGRNELIARYIELRTGKKRSRKQVSSHIQVLARRKAKEHHAQTGGTVIEYNSDSNGMSPSNCYMAGPMSVSSVTATINGSLDTAWQGHAITTNKIRLVEFCALVEHHQPSQLQLHPQLQPQLQLQHKQVPLQHFFVHIRQHTLSSTEPKLESIDIKEIYDKFPDKEGGLRDLYERGPQNAFFLVKFWANIKSSDIDQQNAFYGFSCEFVSPLKMSITCSTKVCSFGQQVVEKVELVELDKHSRAPEFVYRIRRSPMCDYMRQFIEKLSKLPERYMMNSVLENFTILQVISNKDTGETLLCTAFVFEVSTSENQGPQHHIYRLTSLSPGLL